MSDFTLLEHQAEFIFSESKKALSLGGIGSGKSFSGSHFSINMLSEFPLSKGLITANTYTQLMNATVETFTGELAAAGIPYRPVLSGPKKRLELESTIIYLYSLEKPDTMRGIEAGWWWSDESAFSKKESIDIARGRLRDKNGPLFERHTSSPNGFNWLYENFENTDGDNKTDKSHLIRAKTKDNIFLPPGYYEQLLEDYGGKDNPLAMQELFGQFVNLQAGAIYWAFKRESHVKPCSMNDKHPVLVGQDFNIGNMCGCYIQIISGHYFVFQENILDHYNANTDNAASKIVNDLGTDGVSVIPDSTGKARKTAASKTDIEILRSHDLEVIYSRNPLIRDRQNTLNVLLKQNRITVDPSCKMLIKELETLSARDDEGSVAHVSVSLGYVAWKFDPLKRERKRSKAVLM